MAAGMGGIRVTLLLQQSLLSPVCRKVGRRPQPRSRVLLGCCMPLVEAVTQGVGACLSRAGAPGANASEALQRPPGSAAIAWRACAGQAAPRVQRPGRSKKD